LGRAVEGGKVTSVEPVTNTVITEFGSHKAAVRQHHPAAEGRAHRRRCRRRRPHRLVAPIDPVTFESKLAPNNPRHR